MSAPVPPSEPRGFVHVPPQLILAQRADVAVSAYTGDAATRFAVKIRLSGESPEGGEAYLHLDDDTAERLLVALGAWYSDGQPRHRPGLSVVES